MGTALPVRAGVNTMHHNLVGINIPSTCWSRGQSGVMVTGEPMEEESHVGLWMSRVWGSAHPMQVAVVPVLRKVAQHSSGVLFSSC